MAHPNPYMDTKPYTCQPRDGGTTIAQAMSSGSIIPRITASEILFVFTKCTVGCGLQWSLCRIHSSQSQQIYLLIIGSAHRGRVPRPAQLGTLASGQLSETTHAALLGGKLAHIKDGGYLLAAAAMMITQNNRKSTKNTGGGQQFRVQIVSWLSARILLGRALMRDAMMLRKKRGPTTRGILEESGI